MTNQSRVLERLVSNLYLHPLPTSPQSPLHAVSFLEFLSEKEIQDRAEAGEGQGQTEGQGQLLPFEPEGCDAVLDN